MLSVIPLSRSGEPLSRQLYLWLRKAILEKTLRPGERLPSTRDLCDQLDVSRTVVLSAYDQLLAEGFVEGRGGSGTYVSAALNTADVARPQGSASIRLSRFGGTARDAAPKMDFPRVPPGKMRYDFSYRRTGIDAFPFDAWRRILLRRSRSASARSLDYGPSAGSEALRRAIASHLRRSRAVVCDPSQVIVVNGSQQAVDLIARVLLEREDRVVLEDPHYQGAREVFRAAGARIVPIAVDADGLNPAKLPDSAKLAFVTPSHQFPTGTILPLSRRLALLDWAKRVNAVVVEDDYDGEFRYEGQSVESLQSLDKEGRVVYVGTFSRTIFPALRIGYLIAPHNLLEALNGAKWLSDRHTATLEQDTLAEFIESGAYERHLRRARRRNAIRRTVLLKAIEQHLGDHVEITGSGSGTHIVLWPKKKIAEADLIAAAAERGVGVYPISVYCLRNRRTGVILGYSRMTEHEIREGIRLLAKVF